MDGTITAVEASDSGWRSLLAAVAVAVMDGLFPAHPERRRYLPLASDDNAISGGSPTDSDDWMTDSMVPDWVVERHQTNMLRQAGLPMLAGTDAEVRRLVAAHPGD